MIQARPYEFMVKYTPQREWIVRRGILLWLAFFFIELGAGMFFVSSFFNNLWGLLIGWLICAVLGGGTHLVYLGHPFRFWRMLISSGWKTSWISRGLYFVTVFLLLGAVHMGLLLWATPAIPLLIVADVFAFLVIIYGGFAMNYVNGIPLWNTALLPILYVVAGIWGGAELMMATALTTGATGLGIAVEEWIRILLVGFIILLAVYLISVRYGSPAGGVSVREIAFGRWAPLLWIAVVALGIALPLGVVIISLLAGLEATPVALLYIAIFCGLLGDLATRYLILRCGYYHPIVPSSVYAY
ncbi:MAG: polysulfide reductase NrfD [Dehalococcoidia bacterium]|nr:polysulfide reductase NrfD [Dehalococcoidia bacterium]